MNVRTWLLYAADVPTYVTVRNRFVTSQPTYMLAVVNQMVKPEFNVEIEVTAVVLDHPADQ